MKDIVNNIIDNVSSFVGSYKTSRIPRYARFLNIKRWLGARVFLNMIGVWSIPFTAVVGFFILNGIMGEDYSYVVIKEYFFMGVNSTFAQVLPKWSIFVVLFHFIWLYLWIGLTSMVCGLVFEIALLPAHWLKRFNYWRHDEETYDNFFGEEVKVSNNVPVKYLKYKNKK